MYWQYEDSRSRLAQGILPQQQPAFYEMPVAHAVNTECRQDLTNFAFADDDGGEVKRPMNSFLLWAKVMRKKYAKENPTMHNAEISKLLGKVWNGMTTNEKRPFVERAERLRVIHMRDHPNYRYAPRKKKDRKQAQRMISPEIAAAFHNAIFDLRTVIDRRQKEEELVQVGKNNNAEYMMLTGRRQDTQSMLYQNFKNQHLNMPENYHANLMSNLANNSGSTFHYYAPESKPKFKYSTEKISTAEMRAEQIGNQRNNTEEDHISSMSYDRQVSANSGHVYSSSHTPKSWCDSSNGDSDVSSLVPSSPESATESLDQEVPPFLRALLEFPLHVDHRRMGKTDQGVPDERSYILNDFGDIVGKESEFTDHRKSCMFL